MQPLQAGNSPVSLGFQRPQAPLMSCVVHQGTPLLGSEILILNLAELIRTLLSRLSPMSEPTRYALVIWTPEFTAFT